MGCDIHCFAEVRKNGIWEKVEDSFPNPYYKEGIGNEIYEDGYQSNPKFIDSPYKRRNYNLFACLANVRNGRGFAGCDTGDGFEPIGPRKGIPEDCSDKIREESEKWDGDGHSHNWLLLSELLNEDYWNKISTLRGVVNIEEYEDYLKKGRPSSYCGAIAGGFVKIITNAEMDEFIKNPPSDEFSYYTKVAWKITYKEAAGKDFFENCIPALKELSNGNFDDVRIVFWFDN